MTRKVDVYVNDQDQPKHLAVLNERASAETGKQQYRSLCGADTNGLDVKQVPPNDVKTGCAGCDQQIKLWKEVNS